MCALPAAAKTSRNADGRTPHRPGSKGSAAPVAEAGQGRRWTVSASMWHRPRDRVPSFRQARALPWPVLVSVAACLCALKGRSGHGGTNPPCRNPAQARGSLMAAMRCPSCGANWGVHASTCRICDDRLVYRKDCEADSHAKLKEVEERYVSRQQQADRDHTVDREFNWRFECLLDAGAPPEVAEVIAGRAMVDLHKACEVFRNGCDPQLAQELLTPVE